MSKSLRSMSKNEQNKAIDRRLMQNKKGLGYWAAKDAVVKKKIGSKS